jgi:hypothetical protein
MNLNKADQMIAAVLIVLAAVGSVLLVYLSGDDPKKIQPSAATGKLRAETDSDKRFPEAPQ